jgi:hypothetical protein
MFFPQTYQIALLLMVLTMLCWGSWANTLKLCPGYRFQLFYWDYALGSDGRQPRHNWHTVLRGCGAGAGGVDSLCRARRHHL